MSVSSVEHWLFDDFDTTKESHHMRTYRMLSWPVVIVLSPWMLFGVLFASIITPPKQIAAEPLHSLSRSNYNQSSSGSQVIAQNAIFLPLIRKQSTLVEVSLSGWRNSNDCVYPVPLTVVIGKPIWYCLLIRNTSSIELTNHQFTQYISPPDRLGARYAYSVTTQFTRTLQPGAAVVITNAFFTRTLTPPLPPVMGPFTVTAPLTTTTKFTNTVYVTSTNPNKHVQVTTQASYAVFVVSPTPLPTPSIFDTSSLTSIHPGTATPTYP